jgi:hypothetical protein
MIKLVASMASLMLLAQIDTGMSDHVRLGTAPLRSRGTSGEAFSLIVNEALVCITAVQQNIIGSHLSYRGAGIPVSHAAQHV